ncbi:MAG: hypothetical protein QOJ38_1872 [Solirubrobacterales bacterium]|jgi:hypothetical protein|nr:hypothetical protein [Solirubrobacterales bacterium]
MAAGNAQRSRPARRRWRLTAVLACVLLTATGAIARADGPQTLGQQTGTNTDFTPVPADGRQLGWKMFDGALYGKNGELVSEPSPSETPFTVDFFTVRFNDDPQASDGFAGGAACADATTPFDRTDDCRRVPAIWQFRNSSWSQVDLPGGAGGKGPSTGYVGALAYMADGNVLAVGGDGVYPRREPGCSASATSGCVEDPGYEDPAGNPRAWLYDGSAWREIGNLRSKLQALTDGTEGATAGAGERPGGMTALDCANHTADSQFFDADSLYGGEYCTAGGLHQLWMWERPKAEDGSFGEGAFARAYDDRSTSGWATNLGANSSPAVHDFSFLLPIVGQTPPLHGSAADSATGSTVPGFRFRVRDIRWDAIAYSQGFHAVTAGCCSEAAVDPKAPASARPGARLVRYDGKVWSQTPVNEPQTSGGSPGGALADSYYSVVVSLSVQASTSLEGTNLQAASVFSTIASAGGPPAGGPGGEPGSRIIVDRGVPDRSLDSAEGLDALDLRLAGVRLVSADADLARPQGNYTAFTGDATSPDGEPDWAVGGLLKGCESPGFEDCQGAAYTTLNQTQLTPNPLTCAPARAYAETCNPSPKATNGQYANSLTEGSRSSGELMSLPSYGLNSIADVGTDGKTIWAVGDKGAIFRRGGNGTVGSPTEPRPPTVGPSRLRPLTDRGPYDSFKPADPNEAAGAVPSALDQPSEQLRAPALVPAGSPDPNEVLGTNHLTSITMSRDGSEGWAATGYRRQGIKPALYHYASGAWTACDSGGIPGQLPADPACSGLEEAHHAVLSAAAMARIPNEYGPDPSRADEFEVMAIGEAYTKPGTSSSIDPIAIYRDGRWSLDEKMRGDLGSRDVLGSPVFSAPDDGWLVTNDLGGPGLFHFDGSSWIFCGSAGYPVAGSTPASAKCGHSDVLPLFYTGSSEMHLTVAGQRTYLAGTRLISAANPVPNGPQVASGGTPYPLIYHRDPGGDWIKDIDPGCELHDGRFAQGCSGASDSSAQGSLAVIAVTQLDRDRFAGWAAGRFGPSSTPKPENLSYNASAQTPPPSAAAGGRPGLLRLDGDPASWRPWKRQDAASDYLVDAADVPRQLLSVQGPGGQERAFLVPDHGSHAVQLYPPLRYDSERGRWEVLPTPFMTLEKQSQVPLHDAGATIGPIAPDAAGGFWGAAEWDGAYFYHYTDRRPKPVFADVPHPVREPIVGTAAGPDGALWMATASNIVYRYDRITGWDRIQIPGWDRGRLVTNPSPARAIAVGADGTGILVGKQGRIADLDARGGVLDAAAGISCALNGGVPPCSTSYELREAAVAPDGAAIAGGERMALLWRPAKDASFRAIAAPRQQSQDVKITGLSLPSSGRAWLTTDRGQLFAGTLKIGCDGDPKGYCWSWKLEAEPSTLTKGVKGEALALHAVEIDSAGRGLAVGEDGLALERDENGSWKRLDLGRTDSLRSIALPPQGLDDGALIGGDVGLVLTRLHGHFQVARQADYFSGITNGWGNGNSARIVGVEALAGDRPGEVEAWAASDVQDDQCVCFRPSPAPSAILHYTNEPSDAALDGGAGRARSLPDAPPAGAEVSFAAFGKQECQLADDPTCPEVHGTNLVNETIARGVVDSLAAPDGPEAAAFALFTGDVGLSGGRDQSVEHQLVPYRALNAPIDTDVIHHRWSELVAQPLRDAGVPLFGALGSQDLSQTGSCGNYPITACAGTRQAGNPGPSLPWRQSMAQMSAPWGAAKLESGAENGPPADTRGHSFASVPASGTEGPSVCTPPADTPPASVTEQKIADQNTPGQNVGSSHAEEQCASASGAHTHYAFDVKRDGSPILRVVVVDTSLKTLSGAAATQNPAEEQLKWLGDVLSSRPAGEGAAVVSETPSYSYGPGGISDTLTDATAFEALMARERVDVVVSGRLGWNGLYYTSTLSPGLHCPAPGDPYPAKPCSPTAGGGEAAAPAAKVAGDVAAGLAGGGGPAAEGAYPTVIAASAGGKFGPQSSSGAASGTASQGFWHGYSLVRIKDDGAVIVEQRPVFDWVGISGRAHVLRAGQKTVLSGYGREPVGVDVPIRYDEVSSPAITHCYDLVLADPEKPWLALGAKDASEKQLAGARKPGAGCASRSLDSARGVTGTVPDPVGGAVEGANPCAPYVCLDPDIGRLTDDQQGSIQAGAGNQKRTFVLAILSVGQKVATYPISFEPRPSFTPEALPPPPPPGSPPAPPPPPAPPGNQLPQINLPSPPAIPNLPIGAGLVPPTAPVPPPPPGASNAAPLNLFLSTSGLQLSPQSTVVPPPAPPIQPAPPGGARKEARQKQAATEDSGAGTDEKSSDAAGDLAQDGLDRSMTRRAMPESGRESMGFSRADRSRPGQSFTTLSARAHRGDDTPAALYIGGITLLALTLALGYTHARPTPRRRQPELPAPAYARDRRRR